MNVRCARLTITHHRAFDLRYNSSLHTQAHRTLMNFTFISRHCSNTSPETTAWPTVRSLYTSLLSSAEANQIFICILLFTVKHRFSMQCVLECFHHGIRNGHFDMNDRVARILVRQGHTITFFGKQWVSSNK